MTIDSKYFYLNTPMERYEYMRLKLADLPGNVIAHYNLNDKATPDGYVHVEIRRGMHGLPQAEKLAHELLEKRLNKAGYTKSALTSGLWTHK